ncbi:MAG: hypothetical protein Tp170SUR191951_46 [Prokaryotic dsDNA virus sp.]|nr:hypothetical protein [Pseudomonas sp.]MBS67344.1 hypothetical protein [Pseudomonas sp.]QDP55208.1 MAG: hypothetical protein Tp170SUR191951_46 [Prokaryotic dsDNA virus sp.]|tara:strand:- start:3191 stop:3487 length:297 start_codon:yes stop_codon:yes gene_type:complete
MAQEDIFLAPELTGREVIMLDPSIGEVVSPDSKGDLVGIGTASGDQIGQTKSAVIIAMRQRSGMNFPSMTTPEIARKIAQDLIDAADKADRLDGECIR